MSRRYVVVGSGIAGLSACEAIRERDPSASITLVGEEPHPFYSRPGLAYLLTGSVPETRLYVRTPAEVAALGITRIHARAATLDTAAHRLALEDGRTVEYDRLLLATGAVSIPPEFEGGELDGVMRLDGLDQARAMMRAGAAPGDARSSSAAGARRWRSWRGCTRRGCTSTTSCAATATGARCWTPWNPPSWRSGWSRRASTSTAARRSPAPWGRTAGSPPSRPPRGSGCRARCWPWPSASGRGWSWRRRRGCETDRGISVSELLETSAADVFAAGDVAQVLDPATGRAELDALWNSALEMGRAAGANLAGAGVPYRKHVPMNVTRVAGLVTTVIGAVGGGKDPDLKTMTRGQSESWTARGPSMTVQDRHGTDRVRVLLGERVVQGAIVMGSQILSHPLARLVADRVDVSSIRAECAAEPRGGAGPPAGIP